MNRTLLRTTVLTAIVVLSTTVMAPSHAAAKTSLSKEIAKTAADLKAAGKKYTSEADRMIARAARAENPAPYTAAAAKLRALGKQAELLGNQASKARSTAALSALRKKKITMHLASAAVYRALVGVNDKPIAIPDPAPSLPAPIPVP